MSEAYPSYPGQQPEGQVPPPAGPTQPVVSARPGGVTAASVITIVLSALSVVGGVIFAAVSGPIADYLRDNPDMLEGFNESERQDVLDYIDSALVGFGAVTVFIGVLGIVLGILVLKPRPWARILLVIGAGLSTLIGLVFTLNLVGLPWLAGSIAVIVLLFTGKANDWFAGRPPRP